MLLLKVPLILSLIMVATVINLCILTFLFWGSCMLASGTTQDASPCPERSPKGAAKISSSNETTGREQTDFPESAKFLVASHTHSNAPKTNLQAMPAMVRSENGSKVALHDSELSLAMGCVVCQLHSEFLYFSIPSLSIYIVFHHIAD